MFSVTLTLSVVHNKNGLYLNRPDPIVFIPLTVDNTGRLYDDFVSFLFWYAHREVSSLGTELSEESDQFRFVRSECFAHLKGVVGLIMTKTSVMRISIHPDLHLGHSYLCLVSSVHVVPHRF